MKRSTDYIPISGKEKCLAPSENIERFVQCGFRSPFRGRAAARRAQRTEEARISHEDGGIRQTGRTRYVIGYEANPGFHYQIPSDPEDSKKEFLGT